MRDGTNGAHAHFLLLAIVALSGCSTETSNNSTAASQLGDGLTYTSNKPATDDGITGDPLQDVVDECTFVGADSVAIFRVSGDPTVVPRCDGTTRVSDLRVHWRVPVTVDTKLAGDELGDVSEVLIFTEFAAPAKGDYFIASLLRDGDRRFVTYMLLVDDEGSSSKTSSTDSELERIELPSSKQELETELRAVDSSPREQCGDRVDSALGLAGFLERVEVDGGCDGLQEDDDALPRDSDIPGDQ